MLTHFKAICSLLAVTGMASCASGPSVSPIDNALLAEVSSAARAPITAARSERDIAEDAHASAKGAVRRADDQVELAQASLKTFRSQLDESKLAVHVANSGSSAELKSAESAHAYALARADYGRERLALRKRELELAKLQEKAASEQYKLRVAAVELKKAEALQGVDLIEAQGIALNDYRQQLAFHEDELKTANVRVRNASLRVDEAREVLAKAKRKMDALSPAPSLES